MPEENNGSEIKSLPAIKVVWDDNTQSATVQLDPVQFKTWDFAIAILEMGIEDAKFKREMSRMAAIQQQMAEQQRFGSLAKKIIRG